MPLPSAENQPEDPPRTLLIPESAAPCLVRSLDTAGGTAAAPAPAPASWVTRLGRRLGSPAAAMVAVPLLVLSTGLFILLNSVAILRESLLEVGSARFADQSDKMAQVLDRYVQGLVQRAAVLPAPSEALLSRVRPLRDRPPGEMFAVFASSPWVQAVTLFGSDGAALRVSRNPKENGGRPQVEELEATQPKAAAPGSPPRPGGLLREAVPRVRDPATVERLRQLFEQVRKTSQTVCSRPFDLAHGGTAVTVAMPQINADGTLADGVVMVDLALQQIGRMLELMHSVQGTCTYLTTAEGTPLAAVPPGADKPSEPESPQAVSARDPMFQEMRFRLAGLVTGASKSATVLQLRSPQGEQVFVAVVPVKLSEGQSWFLCSHAPLRLFLGAVTHNLVRGLAIGLAALALACTLGYLLARRIGQVQAEEREARQQAEAAQRALHNYGSYRLVRRVGVGGMGHVWVAEHRLLARPVAIKVIPGTILASNDADVREQAIQRFQREARAIATLRSRHTVTIHDFGVTDDGSLFYAMELLDGLSLDQLVQRHGPQPVGRVRSILAQTCLSLAEAHDKGLIHRDIKPANIFLSRHADEVDVVKVIDFGIVSFVRPAPGEASLTQRLHVCGTPSYLPPEAVGERRTPDPRSDLYSLGAVGFYLLTGRELFVAADPWEVIRRHLSEEPPDIATLVPQPLPTGLAETIHACLRKTPEQRPAHARDLLARLHGVAVPATAEWTPAAAAAWWEKNLPAAPAPPPPTVDAGSTS